MTIEKQVISLYETEHVSEDVIARRLKISVERVIDILDKYYYVDEGEALPHNDWNEPDFADWEEDILNLEDEGEL